MWYKIVSAEIKIEGRGPAVTVTPFSATVQIQMQDSDAVETHVVPLTDADMRQFENLLRQKLDKVLNG